MGPDIEAIRFKDDGTFEAVSEEKGAPPRKKQSNNRSAPSSASIVSLSDESDDDNVPLNRGDNSASVPPPPPSTPNPFGQRPVVVQRSASDPPLPTPSVWTNGSGYEQPPPPRAYAPAGGPDRNDNQFMWNVNPSGSTVDEAILIDSDED